MSDEQSQGSSFSIQPVVDSLDSVPELFREFYSKTDDNKYKLESITGLKNGLHNARRQRDEFKEEVKKLQAFAELGVEADQVKEMLEAQKAAELSRAEKAGEFDKIKAQMAENYDKELKKYQAEKEDLTKALHRELVTARSTAAIAELKGIPDLLLPHVERQLKVVGENGQYSVAVVDSEGSPRLNSKNEPMTIKELVEAMKNDPVFGRAFEGTGHNGSGASPNGGRGGAGLAKKSSEMSAAEKSAYISEHGLQSWQDKVLSEQRK